MYRQFCALLFFAVFFSAAMFYTIPSINAASLPADQIFPGSTKGFVSIRNFKDFGEQWKQTQFGRFLNDPLMQNFKNEVNKQLTDRLKNTFGLTLDNLPSLSAGEVALGMIAIPGQVPGYVFTMDVTGKHAETSQYLSNLSQKLVELGVKQSTEAYKGYQITSLIFPIQETPRTIKNARVEITFQPIERHAYYMFVQDIFIASDQLSLIRLIADRLSSPGSNSLASIEAYQVVMQRCISDMPSGTLPSIQWYIDPLDYGESIRTVLQGPIIQSRREKPSVFSILKQQGFDAVQGIGGTVNINTEAQESVYRAFIYTKKPYRLAMQIFNFPDSTNFNPPVWMRTDLARCTILHAEPLAMFDYFGGLFDALVMPGEEGVWNDILMGLEEDPHGPQINLREELIAHLGNRAFGLSRYTQPITVNSESLVVAVELKSGSESAILSALKKLFDTDPEMRGTAYRTHTIWQRIPSIAVPSASSDEDAERPPLFPRGGMTAAKGYLFVSTDAEYLKTILDSLDAPAESPLKPINELPGYIEVNQTFAALGLADKPRFVQYFALARESLRPPYEMLRQGQMPQSQSLLSTLVTEFLLPTEQSGARRQKFDGSTMPEFEKVQHYFGKAGMCGVTEEHGYFLKGFTIK